MVENGSVKDRIVRNERDINEMEKRVSNLEKDSWNLTKDAERLEEILLDLKNVVSELNSAITGMQMKPAKDFEAYKKQLWMSIIGFIVAYILGKYL